MRRPRGRSQVEAATRAAPAGLADPPAGPRSAVRRWFWRALALLSALILFHPNLTTAPAIHAQAQPGPAYWQYSAPGRIDRLLVDDLNSDGIAELVVAANDTNVVLLNSNGRAAWVPFQTESPVRQLAAADLAPELPGLHEIVIATRTQLILLDGRRNLLWSRELSSPPLQMATVSPWLNGAAAILVAGQDGSLTAYDGRGESLWQFDPVEAPAVEDARSQLVVADFGRDGAPEILFSYFTARRFTQLVALTNNGSRLWERPLTGEITALVAADFGPNRPQHLAVATSRGLLELVDVGSNRVIWTRTPSPSSLSANRIITSLTMVDLPAGRHLVLGTAVGKAVAYDAVGRRLWTTILHPTPERRVLNITTSPARGPDQPFFLALTLAPTTSSATEPSQVLLLDSNGLPLPDRFNSGSDAGLSRLLDINKDGQPELLLAGFGNLQLLDPGIGAGENLQDWTFRLDAEPQIARVADVDADGQDELLVGGDDGRLHLLGTDGTRIWTAEFDGVVTHLDFVPATSDSGSGIVVVYNGRSVGVDGLVSFSGHVVVLHADSQSWADWTTPVSVPTTITSLLLHDLQADQQPEILFGTGEGQVVALDGAGQNLWTTTLNGSVEFLLGLPLADNGRTAVIAGTQARQIHLLSNKGLESIRASYFRDIIGLELLPESPGSSETQLVVAVEDSTVRGIDLLGSATWQFDLESPPVETLPASPGSLLVATDDGELLRLDITAGNSVAQAWRLTELGRIQSLFWGDLDGDGQDDVAVGNREGQVTVFTADGRTRWDELQLGSSVTQIAAMRRDRSLPAELAIVTINGQVQHFRAQANRPPLLIEPALEVAPGIYSVGISTINVEENDNVSVTLELWDPAAGVWRPRETRQADPSDSLTWQLDPTTVDPAGLRYRFVYEDGTHRGSVELATGPAPILAPDPFNPWPVVAAAAIAVAFGGTLLYSQTRSLDARVRRFYGRVRQQPGQTLSLVEVAYNLTGGSPDYLLNLAGRARQDNNRLVAGLADGLFLLADRPQAGLPIINGALEDARNAQPVLHQLDAWRQLFRVVQALYMAPSITELSLLRPQLRQLLESREPSKKPSSGLEALMPILTNLRDSERVDSVDDRLVYLNEAVALIGQLEERLSWLPTTLEADILAAIADRWAGLCKAEVESLRGQARLETTLTTRRLAPSSQAVVALEIRNVGRAPAENVRVRVTHDAAYEVLRQPEEIPFLPAGRHRQVECQIRPRVDDRFRLVCDIVYNDRLLTDKHIPFGDMVHLLPPQRSFSPIRNPYSPGTPLRRDSHVFFGREDLFQFIAETASRHDQQNILILVGQRRTGKTSLLLRLGQHLPVNLLPVYIDCQSLGVVQGIGPFFHDIAWLIADSLAERAVVLEVPELGAWHENPAGLFQRHFLPQVRRLLPKETQLLLVFDEFEAFEDLVEKAILPPTLFTYLRHLMQHGRGLSFVFVGTRRLEEMTSNYWSVLFNIALYKQIDFLPQEAAIRLISEPVAPHIVYDDLALDKILRVTAGHPYFLQLVCYTLVNRANKLQQGYVTISDVNAALDEMLRLGEVHFAYLWQLSTKTERMLLTAVAHHIDPDTPFHPIDIVQYLEPYGFRLHAADVTAGLDRLVERDIMRELTAEGATLYELKIGLVGLWTARNKSLSRLYENPGQTNGAGRRTRPSRDQR